MRNEAEIELDLLLLNLTQGDSLCLENVSPSIIKEIIIRGIFISTSKLDSISDKSDYRSGTGHSNEYGYALGSGEGCGKGSGYGYGWGGSGSGFGDGRSAGFAEGSGSGKGITNYIYCDL